MATNTPPGFSTRLISVSAAAGLGQQCSAAPACTCGCHSEPGRGLRARRSKPGWAGRAARRVEGGGGEGQAADVAAHERDRRRRGGALRLEVRARLPQHRFAEVRRDNRAVGSGGREAPREEAAAAGGVQQSALLRGGAGLALSNPGEGPGLRRRAAPAGQPRTPRASARKRCAASNSGSAPGNPAHAKDWRQPRS